MAKYPIPANLEAERVVLGAFLLDSEQARMSISSIDEKHFSGEDKRNILIFRAMRELNDLEKPVDSTSVIDQLSNNKTLEDAGGLSYIMDLLNSVINPDNVEYYINIIKDQALLRDFLKETDNFQNKYITGNFDDIHQFTNSTVETLSTIASANTNKSFREAGKIAREVAKGIEEAKRSSGGLTGVNTGYKRLNKLTHGWQKGDLIILAARPSVGKTAFALNLMLKAAQDGKNVAFFSCEMGEDKIMQRIISCVGRVEMDHIATGQLFGNDKRQIEQACNELSRLNLFIDDTPTPKLGDLVAKAKKLDADHKLGLIAIDYLNLITVDRKMNSRQEEVALVTKTLKQLARNLECPVIALCQLNRAAEQNDNHIPMLSNLKESGSIEQDADIVMLMHRRDYYKNQGNNLKDQNPGDQTMDENFQDQVDAAAGENKNDISVVNINVAKNRNGQVGPCTLLFSKAFSLFDNPSDEMAKKYHELDD